MTRLLAVLMISCAALAACGGDAAPTPTPSAPQQLALRTAVQPPQACMDALASGRLVPTPLTGLGLLASDGSLMPVEWPFGYGAARVDGVIVLHDENGVPVAREGELVQVPGGFGAQVWHSCPPIQVTGRPI